MKTPTRPRLVDLESIMELLTDLEAATVSTAEAPESLDEGEEYVDLQQLEQGVLRADGVQVRAGDVLARKAVAAQTWERIVALLNGTSARES